VRKLWSILPALLVVVAAAPPSAAAPVDTWAYQPATRQLVGANGTLPFTIQGGATYIAPDGSAAIKFTTSPSLATSTGTSFYAPGTQDFVYQAVLSMDRLRSRSTPNVFQYGLYDGAQVKLQLSRTGVPMCVLHGTGGRIKLTSRTPSLNDGGRQHTFSCWRTGGTVGATVDGVSTTASFALGDVTPTGQATSGNRTSTGSAGDQLFGKIWSLSVSIG
jgi:hypothetical protein